MSETATLLHNLDGWQKYQLVWAARPFSLVVAVAACLQGIILGWSASDQPFLLALLLLTGGILLQFGVNLINDYSDLNELELRFPQADAKQLYQLSSMIKQNFRYGLGCFALALLIGLYLIYFYGLPLLGLFVLGLAGAYFYTQEPICYKKRGLGVPLVFWLMGVLMVVGSYYVMTGHYDHNLLWHALPLSLLTSLLLLSNELRDYESDQRNSQHTLTVRIGYGLSVQLYLLLTLAAFVSVFYLWQLELLAYPWLILLALPVLKQPLLLLLQPEEERRLLTPLTGRFHGIFALLLLISYLLA